MIIKNAQVFQEDGSFLPGELHIKGGKITASGSDGNVLDANGAYAVPGLTDIHFHGCNGYDLCDGTPSALKAIASYELENGITQICPATMTLPEEKLAAIARTAGKYAASQEEERKASTAGTDSPDPSPCPGPAQSLLVGLHMEGPFLSLEKKGAQNPLHLKKPDISLFRRLQEEAGGLFRLVTIAPEEEGALEFIRQVRGEAVLSLGHTAADYETAARALKAGASHITHLYNAMPPFSHRSPGVIGAAFDDPGCMAELICDGVHIAPAMVRAAFRLFGDDRIVLISDSMRAAGLADGSYSLGGLPVDVKGPLAVLKDGTIAGSVTNLMDCMRRAVLEMGIPLGSAVKCAAVNPAKAIGIYDRFGSLAPEKNANIVLLGKNLELQAVIFQGEPVIFQL